MPRSRKKQIKNSWYHQEIDIKVRVVKKTVLKKEKEALRPFVASLLRVNPPQGKYLFPSLRKLFLKTSAILVIVCINWAGLSGLGTTVAYLNDTESSLDNNFIAGTLDFVLTSPSGFDPSNLEIGESATRTISFVNNGNIPKYIITATNTSGLLCDYLDLTANVDGGDAEYSGDLALFNYGPIVFSEPEDWVFTLTLAADTPEDLIGENCQFNFVFFGSQIRNDLPFGQGFNDTEEENNNVKATICYDAETRSKGYWKNHDAVYKPYLPQYLGCNSTSSECVSGYEEINTKAKVTQILETDYDSSMRNKLRGQLLAMKFNIAHFKIGEYIPGTSTENLNQIVANADDLLQQIPEPPNETLEAMKDLLDGLNQDLQFRACSTSIVKVIIPNGGEIWWVGRYYDLTWTTKNLICPNDSMVSIWYSRDSGTTWGNIATSTENDGIYNWRIPLFLENGTYYVPSDQARIKVVTRCSENLLVNGWDMSDEDFCPPIDYDLLLPEEIEALKAMGLYGEPSEPGLSEEPSESTSTEATSTEEIPEILIPSSGPTEIPTVFLEETLPNENSVSSDPLIEETTTEETLIEENILPEECPPEETPIEETPTEPFDTAQGEETLIIQETPITEPEPVIVPDSNSSIQNGDGGNGNGETGGSSEVGAPADAGVSVSE